MTDYADAYRKDLLKCSDLVFKWRKEALTHSKEMDILTEYSEEWFLHKQAEEIFLRCADQLSNVITSRGE